MTSDPFHDANFVQGYDAFAKESGAYSGMMNLLLDMTSVMGKRVADVGAGTGAGIEPILARHPAQLIAAEPSGAMVEKLRANYSGDPRVTIAQVGAQDLSCAGKFDVALSSHVFPYL